MLKPLIRTIITVTLIQTNNNLAQGSVPDCLLSLHRDLPRKHEPLYFIQKGNTLDMLMPHMVGNDGIMTLQSGQQLVLACPGRNNKLIASGAEATLSKCVGGIMLNINDKQFPTYQLECENPAQALLQVTAESCALKLGRELRIGFESPNETLFGTRTSMPVKFLKTIFAPIRAVWNFMTMKNLLENPKSSQWINLVTSCHNLEYSETLYSTHIIYGTSLAGAVVKETRPQFQQGNDQLYPGFDPSHYYRKIHQRMVFSSILGKRRAQEILQDNFLSRGHLAPDADFLFGTWQYMTYFYANTAPQWLTINAGSWQQLEKQVRWFAIKTKANFLVTTGTHGILALRDTKMRYRKIFLYPEEKRLPVPKYFWKVVSDPSRKACIAFVGSNNPFLKRAPNLLCPSICDLSGWSIYSNFSKGYVYCCDYEELRKKILTIPPNDCATLLLGPKSTNYFIETR